MNTKTIEIPALSAPSADLSTGGTAHTQPATGTADLSNLFIVWYIPNRTIHSASRTFRMPTGEMGLAIARAKRHCECQNFRFLRVDPFVCDFDRLDNFMNERNV